MKRSLYPGLCGLFLLIGLLGCASSGSNTHNSPTPTHVPNIVISPTSSATTPAASANGNVDQTLQQIITRYYDAVQAGNYPQAYTYLDASATDANGQTITLSSFEQLAQSMDSQEGSVASFTVAAYTPMVIITITRSQIGPYHTHLQMKQVGSTWKIISLDRI